MIMTAQETVIRGTAALVAASVFRAIAMMPDVRDPIDLLNQSPAPVVDYIRGYLTDCFTPDYQSGQISDNEDVLFWLLAAEDAEDEGLDLMDGLEVRVAA
jgi:hypothetical protein